MGHNKMLKILPIPKEISDKYSIQDNTFIQVAKDDPKDFIEVEVGDIKQPDFLPQLKLKRWDNEVNFSVRLIDNEVGTPQVSTLTDKIIWSKGNIDIEYYDYPGGYKFIWYLKKKPATNKVEFSIQSKGLDFYYQPELTQKEIDEGASRPENVVGSYAVYMTNPGTNWVGGKEYKAGKFGHIYRPHLYDSNGLEAWGDLHIENGIYSVEIPQEFLDKAIYPIKSNDTFGWTSIPASSNHYTANRMYGNLYTGPADMVGVSMTIYTSYYEVGAALKMALYLAAGELTNNLLTNGITGEINPPETADWMTSNFVVQPTLSAVDYKLSVWHSGIASYRWYDTAVDQWHITTTYGDWPNPVTWDGKNDAPYGDRFGIYATYTPAGGQTLTESCTEVLSLVDVPAKKYEAIKSITEVLSLAEILAKSQGFSETKTETIGMADIQQTQNDYHKSKTDTLILNEIIAIGRKFSVAVTDIIRITPKLWEDFVESVTDTLNLSEITAKTTQFKKTITDTLSLTEVISKLTKWKKTFTDPISLTDIVSKLKASFVSITETLALNEIVSKLSAYKKTFTNPISLSDIISSTKKFSLLVSERIKLIEIVTAETLHRFEVLVLDFLQLNEVTAKKSTWAKIVTDPISLNEIIDTIKKSFVSVIDSISLSDIIAQSQRTIVSITETLKLNEVVSKLAGYKKSITDAISLVEGVVASTKHFFEVVITETLSLVDSITKKSTYNKAFTNTLSLADSVIKKLGFKKAVTDVITLVDSISIKKVFVVIKTEVIKLVDAITKKSTWSKVVTETIVLRDIVSAVSSAWSWATKHTATWADAIKHTATYNFIIKSTSTWTHQNKSEESPTWTHKSKSEESPTWTFFDKHQ